MFDQDGWRKAICHLPWSTTDRCRIVVKDSVDLPEWSDHRLEPLLINPLVEPRQGLWGLFFMAALLVATMGQRIRSDMDAICFLTFMFGLAIPVLWLSGLFGTTYFRITPGRIERLRYGPFSRQPQIRDYPIAAGTTVVLSKISQAKGALHAVVLRAGLADVVVLSGPFGAESDADRFLRAIFSSASAPALPENELLG